MSKYFAILLLFFVSVSIFCTETEDYQAVGTELLHRLWESFKEADMEAIEAMISEGFQSVHQDGASDYKEEIELVSKLAIDDYKLDDIKISSEENVIVITYTVSVAETIAGKRLSKTPASRLTVFTKNPTGWKWTAHANLKPMNQ